MRSHLLSSLMLMGLLVACAPMGVVQLEPVNQARPEVVLDAGFVGGHSLRLALQAAKAGAAYALQGDLVASPVHAWAGSDVMHYEVALKWRDTNMQFVALSPAVEGQVLVNSYGSGSLSLQQLRPGLMYRVDVKAMGRAGGHAGNGPIQQLNLNANSDHVDLDFTAENDVASQQDRVLQVQLDAVPFAGQGALHFGNILPGGYASPTAGVGISE